MSRVPDWPERLAVYVALVAALPFRWGSHDCALFAADWVQLATGRDLGKPWRGLYRTGHGARHAMAWAGCGGVEDVAGQVLPAVPVALARRGDVVSADLGAGVALGVVTGAEAVFVRPRDGLVRVPVHVCSRAWRV